MKDVTYGPQAPVKESFGEDIDVAIQKAVHMHDQATRRVHLFAVILFLILIIVLVW
jgi:hypothetical protein